MSPNPDLVTIIKVIQASLTDDLRKSEYRGLPNPLAGHCYIASEAAYYILGGKDSGYTPMFVKHENQPHWFLQKSTGQILDITANQFRTKVPYDKAIGKGFLTNNPSKRAKVVIDNSLALIKMAIQDIRPGEKIQGIDNTYDYSHLVPSKLQDQYRIHLHHLKHDHNVPDSYTSILYHNKGDGNWAPLNAKVVGFMQDPTRLKIHLSHIGSNKDDQHRGKGLGRALYESLLAHGKHYLGAQRVIGGYHSTSAMKTHRSLAQKHGLEYRPEVYIHSTDIHGINYPSDYDSRYLPYEYAIKNAQEIYEDIAKVRPGPKFPKLGLADDPKETPIITTPTQLASKARALTSAAGVPSGTEEHRSNVGEIVSDKSAWGRTTGNPKRHISYSLGGPLRERNIEGTLDRISSSNMRAPLSTKLHEDFHMMMNRVAAKHGTEARHRLASNLFRSIPSSYRDALKSYMMRTRGLEILKEPEEMLAHVINYVNNPGDRRAFHIFAGLSPTDARIFDNKMNRAHRALLTAAETANPNWFTPNWVKSEMELTKKEVDKVASVAIYNNDGHLLFGKRNDSGKWTLPGGHLKVGENHDLAARRELLEETGLDGTDWEYLDSGIAGPSVNLRIYCYKCKIDGEQSPTGDSDPDGECSEWKWVDVSKGLPKEIAENLHAQKNITLRLIGLQNGEVHKAEITDVLGDFKVAKLIRHHDDLDIYDYSHLLSQSEVDNGFFLQVNDKVEREKKYSAVLMSRDKMIGELYFSIGQGEATDQVKAGEVYLVTYLSETDTYKNLLFDAGIFHARQILHAHWIDDPRYTGTKNRIANTLEIEVGDLSKGLKEKFMGIATAAALASSGAAKGDDLKSTTMKAPYSRPSTATWNPNGLSQEMYPIAHLESSWGKRMEHVPNSKGVYHSAYGAVGLKPVTAHEQYKRDKVIQKLYPDLHEETKFIDHLKSNPVFYNMIASSIWNRLKRMAGGDPNKAAYGWRWGEGAMARNDPLLIRADPYVQAFGKLFSKFNASPVINKSLFKNISDEWLSKSSKLPSKYWTGQDGIRIPVHNSTERSNYNKVFNETLHEVFGNRGRELAPIKVNTSELTPSNQIVNSDRYKLYGRMVRAKDPLPPIVVQRSGNGYNIIDGNHRFYAARDGNLNLLDAFEIKEPDLINTKHGQLKIYDMARDRLGLVGPKVRSTKDGDFIEPSEMSDFHSKLKSMGYHGLSLKQGHVSYFDHPEKEDQ